MRGPHVAYTDRYYLVDWWYSIGSEAPPTLSYTILPDPSWGNEPIDFDITFHTKEELETFVQDLQHFSDPTVETEYWCSA